MKRFNTHLILASVCLAIILGIYIPLIFAKINFLGEIFINLLKLFALPLICSALIVAIGQMANNINKLKSLTSNIMFYMLISEVIAVTIALCLFNFFKPGVGINPDLILHGSPYEAHNVGELSFTNFVLSIIPHNIFDSLVKFDLLPVVIFAIMFGIGAAVAGDKGKPVITVFASIRDIANNCLNGVMIFSPIGIFALVGKGIADSSLNGSLSNSFVALLMFIAILLLGLILHGLWQVIAVIILTPQKNLWVILKQSIPVFSTAFATSSSIATLPIAMGVADKLKAKPHVTRFMLPLCAPINIGGMMMYEVAAALFFCQVLGMDLSLTSQILLAIACILGGMAEGGIPETSLVSLVIVFKIVNVPLSAISILLPLDRIIDRLRTMINIFGNMCGTLIVSRFVK